MSIEDDDDAGFNFSPIQLLFLFSINKSSTASMKIILVLKNESKTGLEIF